MTLPDPYPITPLPGPFRLDVDFLPGSKSLTNRALLLAALADGVSTLSNVLFADDTRVMMAALKELGFHLDIDEASKTVTVHGQGGKIPNTCADLFLGNAGTAMRFLTAAVCLGSPGSEYTLRGVPRMHQRPIGQLVEPLRQLGIPGIGPGIKIEYLENEGYPPLRITLPGAACGLVGHEISLTPTISSQFISALMQIGPFLPQGLTIRFDGPITSESYVQMTKQYMELFGADVTAVGAGYTTIVKQKKYHPHDFSIEPDASNASYFFAATATCLDSYVSSTRLTSLSCQGDAGFASKVLRPMGADVGFGYNRMSVKGQVQLSGIDIDLGDMPDMAQTLAVVALFAEGETVIRNVGNLRVKETDRIAALQKELTKLGAKVTVMGDDIHIQPPAGNVLRHPDGTVIGESHPVVIDTYDDHRMAMSFAVAGLRQAGVRIADPKCVNKTYPEFFEHLNKLHDAARQRATPGLGPGPGVKR